MKALLTHCNGLFPALTRVLPMALCLIATPTQTLAQTGRIELSADEQTLSASIRDARLLDVLSTIEDQLGIWVRGIHHVSDETVSVEFESVPLERGLDRILSSADYSLVFDGEGDILGVILINSTKAAGVRRPQPRVRPRALPSMPQRTLPRSRSR